MNYQEAGVHIFAGIILAFTGYLLWQLLKCILSDQLEDYIQKKVFKMDIGWSDWSIVKLMDWVKEANWDIKELKLQIKKFEESQPKPSPNQEQT